MPKLLGLCDKVLEILERAQFRMNRLVPALLRANGPGAALVARLGWTELLFGPLRKLRPMG